MSDEATPAATEAGEDETPPLGTVTVRTMAMPRDANWLGDIFGGWLMSHADVAGGILAYQQAGGKVVTVAVNEFLFLKPVYVGDVVSCYTSLLRVGRTSLRIAVDIRVDRPGCQLPVPLQVATACITYVHVGEDRRPRPIAKDGQQS
ncbi:MAG: acyl-CoA thioesterase [Pseudomonadota bacterium]